ncbi:hypothetical protein [Qipengyuania marisflavi]|uniref:Uncharacterized protein n=1 Tax=Qipengyuania marisflavi TaxID=2486356 RepID=A0A5S3P533_9SPHN|nr:hypothetical protein [Qipengyuania marisflavi]TMM48149.1 hypothetical protein FEV51_07565 [Qipengyuania marisflavi]
MANRKSPRSRRWFWLILIAAALAGAAWIVWGEGVRKTGAAATAYGARVACSCRFVAGRSLDDCGKDKLEGMELVSFSEDEAGKSVTAAIPLIASDTATYRKGYGCMLKEWEG